MVEPSPNDEDAEVDNGISKTLMGGRVTTLPTMYEAGNLVGPCNCGSGGTWETAEGGDSAAALLRLLLVVVLEEKDTATAPAPPPGQFRLASGLTTRRGPCRRDRASPREGSISVSVTTKLQKLQEHPGFSLFCSLLWLRQQPRKVYMNS